MEQFPILQHHSAPNPDPQNKHTGRLVEYCTAGPLKGAKKLFTFTSLEKK